MRTPKDWGQPCPNPECTHDRRLQQGNVSAIATYLTQSGKRRILRCLTGATHFAETRETVCCALRTSEEQVMMALKMLLVRLMSTAIVGLRTLDTAKEGVAATQARVAGIPAFFSDGFTGYLAALIASCHVVTTCARTGKRGRPRQPRCTPHTDLLYGQLVKQQKQGQLRTLSTRVVLGAERLTSLGLTISTALVRVDEFIAV